MVDLKITDERLQEELQRSHILLNAINDAQSHFISDSEECILFNGLLKNLLLLTKSKYGFIGEVLHTPTGEPYLKTKAITNIAWNDETRELYKKNAPVGMEFYNTKTLFGQVMITGKTVIANNPSKDDRRGGLPPDHPPLISFLGVPFYQGRKLVGMAGIANCPGGYKEDLVEYLKPMLTTCANIIVAYRNENQRKRTEEELVHRARLAELGNEIGIALSHGDILQSILQRCTESIVKNLEAAFAHIWTFNQRDEVLELQASAGIYTNINGSHSRIPIGMYKIGHIAEMRKPHLTNRVIGDPEVHDQEWARQEKIVSFAGYPLIIEERLVGVMAIFSRQPLMDFSLKALSSVADNIANGIVRKQVEEKKKQSEEKYRDLFQNANDAICILGSDLKYKDVNNKTLEMLGYTKEELLNMSVYDIIPSEQLPKSEIEFNKLRIKGSYEKFVGKARTKDGRLIDVEVSSSVIKEGENIIGSRDIIRDITERMQNEEALRESEGRYRTIIEYSNDMIWTLDKEGRFLFFNKRSEEITGHRLKDWQGKSFVPLISEKDLPNVIKVFHKIMEGQSQQYEASVKNKDGSILIVSVNTAPMYSKGKVIGTVSFGRDITDRKRSEEKLRESEERFKSIFDNALDGILVADIEKKKIMFSNRMIYRMLGFDEEELKNMFVWDLHPEKDIPYVVEQFEKQMRKEIVLSKYVPMKRKDGSVFYADVNSTPITIGGKKYILCILRDTTERKQAEEVLLESKNSLQEAQRLAHIGSWQWEVATDTVKWSDELYHINGYDPNSSTPSYKEMSSYYTPESWKRLSAVVAKALKSGESYELDLEMVRPDGTIIDTSARGEADYDVSGKIVGLHGTVQNITERKRVLDMIKESETRLQSILDNSSTVVFLKDIQGRYITVNRRYEELFHVKQNEVVNKTDYDIFPLEYADKFRMHDKQAVEKRCAIEMEEVVPHDDGLHTYISVKFPLLSPDGKPYAICGIATDITERKKAEEHIEKSLQEKEVLLRELHHRVKNNMQIITSLLNLQSRYARDGEYREMFRESHNRIKSMSLVHEKLYHSKDLSTIDFKEYINDIAKGLFLSYGANKGKIELIMDINNISLDIDTAIPCGLIINELVTNSIKHAFPEGKKGEIKIAVYSMKENTIELVVGDNGIGISEDVDFKTTESLGLQLVTMLAENQLHGEIILDRSKGTEFTITFKEVK